MITIYLEKLRKKIEIEYVVDFYLDFKTPHRTKSDGATCGNLTGHFIRPTIPIDLPETTII